VRILVSRTTVDRTRRSRAGFSLIELMIVIVIIGILAAVGLANFISLTNKARYASCISNQKHVHEAAIIYGMDNDVVTQNINVTVLTAAGLIMQEVGECPSSANVDFNDYSVQYVGREVTALTCSIKGAEHLYTP
jgi:prepilin-type N-terminal cleavage/methylation domain-containing protein